LFEKRTKYFLSLKTIRRASINLQSSLDLALLNLFGGKMIARKSSSFVLTLTIFLLAILSGCNRELSINEPAQYPTDSPVFLDAFGPGIGYQAFSNSKLNALSVDFNEKYDGEKSLKITVPSAGDPSGWFAGGAFVNSGGRDLSGYNALTFWAKASQPAVLGLAGFGNDNTGTSKYEASVANLQITTAWQKFVVPIPLASKLIGEKGLFEYAAGASNSLGYYLWFDDIKFENLGTIAHPRPIIANQTVNVLAGDSLNISGTSVVFNVYGKDQLVTASPGYFTFTSSNDSVATVDANGMIRVLGSGTATITGSLGSTEAAGTVTVIAGAAPIVAPPAPTFPASDVISLLTKVYTNIPIDTWSATWDQADVQDKVVAGDNVKLYNNLNYAGIEFIANKINATSMNYFHIDIWTPNPTTPPAAFKIKLVDFGPNGAFGGGDDTEAELTFNSTSNPPLTTGSWVSYDIPLSNFVSSGLTNRAHLAQLIISGGGAVKTVWVDNVYFHK
jgi:hypothetical protein